MKSKNELFEKIILFSVFVIFAVIIVYFVYDNNKGQELYDDTYSFQYTTSKKEDTTSDDTDKKEPEIININTATPEQLDTLPGIGPSKAAAIIKHREDNGDFTRIEDIMNVSGIGETIFRNLKQYITVE